MVPQRSIAAMPEPGLLTKVFYPLIGAKPDMMPANSRLRLDDRDGVQNAEQANEIGSPPPCSFSTQNDQLLRHGRVLRLASATWQTRRNEQAKA